MCVGSHNKLSHASFSFATWTQQNTMMSIEKTVKPIRSWCAGFNQLLRFIAWISILTAHIFKNCHCVRVCVFACTILKNYHQLNDNIWHSFAITPADRTVATFFWHTKQKNHYIFRTPFEWFFRGFNSIWLTRWFQKNNSNTSRIEVEQRFVLCFEWTSNRRS